MNRNASRTRAVALVAAMVVVLASAAAAAKPRVAHVETNAEDREIKLWVDIRKGGKVIKSPESSKLKVLVDGSPYGGSLEISNYGDTGDGMYILFVVDSSAIWERSWDDIREGVKGFISRMRGDKHEVSLVILREGKAENVVPFTSEITDIGDYLDGLTEVEGISPKLFKALTLGIKMHAEEEGKNWRRVIVFGSDLEDETSLDPTAYAGAYTDLMKELSRTDVELSMVFMTAKIDAEGKAEVDPKIIKKAEKLCEKTNGFFVQLDGISGIAAGYKEVADNINSMAVVTLKADDWPSVGSHLVSVRYDEIDSKEFDVTFEEGEAETPDDMCELDADCLKGEKCDKNAEPYAKCVKAAVKAPPKEEGWAWWIWGLIGLGGLGILIVIIALIAGRSPGPAPQMAQAQPMMGHGPCMECGQPNRPGPACQQQCAARARGRFVVTAGDMSGKIFYLLEEVTTFGKAEGNNYIIMDGSVSSKHFGIKIDDTKYELADFGSTNGTFINGLRAKKQYLKTGDVIRVGNTEMTFHYK